MSLHEIAFILLLRQYFSRSRPADGGQELHRRQVGIVREPSDELIEPPPTQALATANRVGGINNPKAVKISQHDFQGFGVPK